MPHVRARIIHNEPTFHQINSFELLHPFSVRYCCCTIPLLHDTQHVSSALQCSYVNTNILQYVRTIWLLTCVNILCCGDISIYCIYISDQLVQHMLRCTIHYPWKYKISYNTINIYATVTVVQQCTCTISHHIVQGCGPLICMVRATYQASSTTV